MNQPDLETLRALIDDLRDAQRYASNWELARGEIPKLHTRLHEAALHTSLIGRQSLIESHTSGSWLDLSFAIERCASNIMAALDLVVTRPTVLIGYLAGAVAEMEFIIEQLEAKDG